MDKKIDRFISDYKTLAFDSKTFLTAQNDLEWL